jgi:hypothetical protein
MDVFTVAGVGGAVGLGAAVAGMAVAGKAAAAAVGRAPVGVLALPQATSVFTARTAQIQNMRRRIMKLLSIPVY